MIKKLFSILLVLTFNCLKLNAFVPEDRLKNVINVLETEFQTAENNDPFGSEGDTFTHEEILRRGVAQSVVKFFYEQPDGPDRINYTKMDEYYKIRPIYIDYYDKDFCKIDLIDLIEEVLNKQVVSVDKDANTKDNPYAHFDAEKFAESNRRVIEHEKLIFTALKKRNYKKARILAGRILHTIHDFYSHSNWVEMGKREINKLIGTEEFERLASVKDIDERTCADNCKQVIFECDTISSTVLTVLKITGATHIKCPLVYYVCDDNISVKDKLLSGFYSNQKLDDGTVVDKPKNKVKCSHGGLFDATANRQPKGGINKDSAFRLVSPHADLHWIAAELAVNHTEFFFNKIRAKIGDVEFVNFMKLERRYGISNFLARKFGLCNSVARHQISFITLFVSFLFITFVIKNN